MADNDNLVLDGDLGLEDGSDDLNAGNDFAGELDDVMGDEELGDSTSNDSDGELDSFFEDLSSIEELDEEDEGDVKEKKPDSSAPSPSETLSPTTEAKSEKSGSKKRTWIAWLLVLVILLSLGVLGVYWLAFRDTVLPLPEETLKDLVEPLEPAAMPKIGPVITVEEKPQLPPLPPEDKLKTADPPKPPKTVPSTNFFIQVATCSFERCVEEYKGKLREIGEPIFQKQRKEKFDFIELISKHVYTLHRANELVRMINRRNKGAGNASIVYQSNGHRITMGIFTALDRAKEIKFYIEKELPQEELVLNLEHVRKDYQTSRVYAGPYRSKLKAKQVLQKFRQGGVFPGAFIVSY